MKPLDELRPVLDLLVAENQKLLGDNLLAVYLQGSFGMGDGDAYSDVDFMIVVDEPIAPAMHEAVQAAHLRVYDCGSEWAKHLEGAYFPKALLRRDDPARTPILYFDNGAREPVLSDHDNTLVVRWVTREYGIPLFGPPASTFIDPIPVDALRAEVRQTMREWGAEIVNGRYDINSKWAQPFVVVSYCRMLQTLDSGRIHSKLAGVQWGQANLPDEWHELVGEAWAERPFPWDKVWQQASAADVARTRAFVAYTLQFADKR